MRLLATALIGLAASAGVSRAQCVDWAEGFQPAGPVGLFGAGVRALASFDDGSQTRLALGGAFSKVGEFPALNVALWDGAEWSGMGAGFNDLVRALAVFDDGSGAKLYAAGEFTHSGSTTVNHIAWWDGANWNPLGTGLNNDAHALAVYDDGTGNALYVAGVFTSAGGVACPRLARWRNGVWTSIGNPGNQLLFALTKASVGGGGERLFVGGATYVGAWDGTSWTNVATSFSGQVRALAEYDDGGGPALYATGTFAQIGGVQMLGAGRWTGTDWQSLPGSPGLVGAALQVFDDGGGPGLFFAFTTAQPVKRWRNGTWDNVGGAFSDGGTTPGSVFCYGTFNDGTAERLYVGGDFIGCDDAGLWSIAQLESGEWLPPSTEGGGLNGESFALAHGDLGSGPRVFASGAFTRAGTAHAEHVAQWNGARWETMGAGFRRPAYALHLHDDGSGETLYAGGVDLLSQALDAVARWNGTDWEQVPGLEASTTSSRGVLSMTSFDVGGERRLYVAGDVLRPATPPGSIVQGYLAWSNGSEWQIVPTHDSGAVLEVVALEFQGSSSLYAAGSFTSIDGVAAERIARFDGVQWSPVGAPLGLPSGSAILGLAVHDDGGGPALYAAAELRFGLNSVDYAVFRFDGSTWTQIGLWDSFVLRSLVSFDDGNGQGLFATAYVSSAFPDARLKVWRNGVWTNVASVPTNNLSERMGPSLVAPSASSPSGELWLGGSFTKLGGVESNSIARYVNECACDATTYCTSGTTSSGCAPTISGVGRASATLATPFLIEVAQVEGARTGHLFYGVNGAIASPWGQSSHFLCVKAPTQRTATQATGGAFGACDGVMTLDWNAFSIANPSALGQPFSVGQDIRAQAFFRDPPGPKTTALSNALSFTICP